MRLVTVFTLALALSVAAGAGPGGHGAGHANGHGKASKGKKVVKVKSYTKKDGTVVTGYDRTAPDHTQINNWSAQGNINPETGKEGTKPVDH